MSADSRLVEHDVEARRRALDTSRSCIVQAPAGSGKTELLIQRYLKLLATVEEPEEVLAITFTNKAAAEMRLRVLRALERAPEDAVTLPEHEQVTRAAARAVLDRDLAQDWQLLRNPRRMRIQTLDALNASIARMQPVSASSAITGNRVAESAEQTALYREAATATMDWLADAGDAGIATETVLAHLDNNTTLYVAYLSRMLGTRDQWLPFVGPGPGDAPEAVRLRRHLERNLETVIEGELSELVRAFPQDIAAEVLELARYADLCLRRSEKYDSPLAALAGLDSFPAPNAGGLGAWQAVAGFLLTKDGAWRRRVNVSNGFPARDDGQKSRMHALLESLAQREALRVMLERARSLPPARYSDEQWSVLLALFELLPLAVAELRRLFTARGVTDFIEIALAAGSALGSAGDPGDVALLLDYQVRHILVDEMQDTSRAQYRMLEALTGGWTPGDGRTLFCVGDPMQSIYRFRNAEVAQFLLARRHGIGSVSLESLRLTQNFRSGEHIVEWFNRVFPSVFAGRDDPARGAVTYAAAGATRSGQGAVHAHPVTGSDRAVEASAGLAVIRRILDEHPDDELAVLVRSRTHLGSLLPLLRDAGIAYQSVELDRLTDLPEIIDVLALTRAAVHAGDRLAWLAVLRAPWIGLDWHDLLALVRNDTQSTLSELLGDPGRFGALSPAGRNALGRALPVLDRLLGVNRSGSLRARVEAAWFELGGTAILRESHAVDNVFHFLDILESFERGGSLPDVAVLEAELDAERVSSAVPSRLSVMTMHRAKGLEFDHVLLFGLGRPPRQADRHVLSWLDLPEEHGAERKIVAPVGRRDDVERDPIHRYIGIVDEDKDRHELSRLLYVATTRARRSLHLLGHARPAVDGGAPSPDPRSLLSLLWPAVSDDFDASARTATDGGEADNWLVPPLRRIPREWSLPAAPPVPGRPSAGNAAPREARVEYEWVGIEARLAGTVVHRWLERFARQRDAPHAGSVAGLEGVSRRWIAEQGASGERIEPIWKRVRESLERMLADPKGRWLLEGEGATELALSGMVGGRLVNGIIDRVRREGGTHWIVDYKTGTHEGGDLAGFLEAEASRYRVQLATYAALYRGWSGHAPRCALYFPLLARFVEVDV